MSRLRNGNDRAQNAHVRSDYRGLEATIERRGWAADLVSTGSDRGMGRGKDLHQLELLHVLATLIRHVTVPPAVVEELAQGRAHGFNLPDPAVLEWVVVRTPAPVPYA